MTEQNANSEGGYEVNCRIEVTLPKNWYIAMTVFALLVSSGCKGVHVDPFPEPIREPKEISGNAAQSRDTEPLADSTPETKFRATPGVIITHTQAQGMEDQLGKNLKGSPISVSFNDVPLVAFINEVFGNELGMSFFISPGLQKKQDLVTLRLTEPLPPAELFATTRAVLEEYGIDIQQDKGILTFVPSRDPISGDVPLLISGRTLANVPSTHRLIFQLVPLKVVRNTQVTGWLKQAFSGHDLGIMEDPDRNAMLLKGTPELVRQAVEMINVLDQPLLKGKNSLIIEPAFVEVTELARELDKILKSEGYQTGTSAGGGSTILLALEGAKKLIVFATDPNTLTHVKEWVHILDEERQNSIEEAIFTYEVQNTQAKDLKKTLDAILGLTATGSDQTDSSISRQQSGSRGAKNVTVVVDRNRNMIIFRGPGKEWGELLVLIKKLDKAVPSVLIEVLMAEISLTDEQGTGFDFIFNSELDRYNLTGGTLGALGVSSKGLSLVLDSAGATRAVLNLFYEDSRVVIRSSPKLVVKSGAEALIEVGNEIPIITQNAVDETTVGGTSNILQQITYRKTGVIMKIKPVVQAGGLVDLEISQELSEARPTANTSLDGSPTILNRRVETSLTLRDGGSLLMGGIINNAQSSGQKGVPFLGRLPVIGRLFRADTFQEDRTELIILVTPHVIADHAEGWALTEQFKEQLSLYNKLLLKK